MSDEEFDALCKRLNLTPEEQEFARAHEQAWADFRSKLRELGDQ